MSFGPGQGTAVTVVVLDDDEDAEEGTFGCLSEVRRLYSRTAAAPGGQSRARWHDLLARSPRARRGNPAPIFLSVSRNSSLDSSSFSAPGEPFPGPGALGDRSEVKSYPELGKAIVVVDVVVEPHSGYPFTDRVR